MTDGPMPCPEGDLPALLALLDRVFRPNSRPLTMAEEYPLFLAPDNRDNLRIVKEDGRVVSHVGLGVYDVLLLGARVRVACVGAVCTDEPARGKGYASALMADAIAHARAQRCSLLLVSGGRGLYRRAGCVGGDVFLRAFVPAAVEDVGQAARLDQSDLSGLVRLCQAEPVRFVRPVSHWQRLLGKGREEGPGFEAYGVRDGARLSTYVCCQPDRGKERLPVVEFAGVRPLVVRAAAELARRLECASAEITLQPDDLGLRTALGASGTTLEPRGFPGTFRLIDLPAFLGVIEPLLSERAGAEVTPLVAGDSVTWRLGEETIEWRGVTEVTERVFLDPVPDGAGTPLADALRALFPLPLPWYGMNYC